MNALNKTNAFKAKHKSYFQYQRNNATQEMPLTQKMRFFSLIQESFRFLMMATDLGAYFVP